MEDRRRTRSQGPPSLSEGNELIQWGSLQEPVRIEREHAEARRIARESNTVNNESENMVECSKIPPITLEQPQHTKNRPQLGEILPKQHEIQIQTSATPALGEISPSQEERVDPRHITSNWGEISPKEPQQTSHLLAMEEGITGNVLSEEHILQGDQITQRKLPQKETAQHYLDDNFSDVMRSSALGSNLSSLFNTTALNNTHRNQKVTLDWVLPDSRDSHLEVLEEKHIADFPAPGGNTGAMLVSLPDLEPFYNTSEFLIDLQSGELFMKLQGKWHSSGLACKKRDFEVDQLMALIQHASN